MRKLLLVLLISIVSVTGFADSQKLPGFGDWDEVLRKAKGQIVNWYIWGGSDSVNNFVDDFCGPVLKRKYGVKLNRVPVADTADVVNQVISEKKAGVGIGEGKVDLIWINGENFFSLRQANLLYGPWSKAIPNAKLVDWDNPAVNLDFGHPVNGFESPWSSAQFHFLYDTARIDESGLPRSYAELGKWIKKNPGKFTYIAPGPGAFMGTRFVKQLMFELSGSQQQWVGQFNKALYDKWAPKVWKMLNEWEPYLWRKGKTYPKSEADLMSLFANSEVYYGFSHSPSGAAVYINSGIVPPTAKGFAFYQYMIADFNYVAIPYNSPNLAAALVTANEILDPILQSKQVQPQNGFCCGWGISTARVNTSDGKAAIEEAKANFGTAAEDPKIMANALVSDIAAEYQFLIEKDWKNKVLVK